MNNKKMINLAVPLLLASSLAACSAPPLRVPDIPAPVTYKEAGAGAEGSWKPAQPAQAQERGQWWKVFADAELDRLIAEASAANPGLAVAAARVAQARAVAGIAAAAGSPTLDAQLGARRGRFPEQGPEPATLVQARLAASYEADLFGRIAATTSAVRADAGASEGTYRSVLLSLQADVAQTYLRLRAIDAELLTLEKVVRLREETVRLTERRRELGDVGDMDVARANTELSVVRADVHALRRQRARSEHALAVLLGRPAAAFNVASDPLPRAFAPPAIPAGLPSALLERRPDISAAQLAMVGANARIGAARAARFPAIRLTADSGGASGELSDVFSWSSRSWALGALASLPLLDGGRNRANIARSEAVLDEATASYRQTVLAAFAEVEDTLSGLRTLAGQAQELQAALATARQSESLAGKAYAAGGSSYLDLLEAQRSLAAVERGAVQIQGERALATVALIRALGGSW